jgi:hypothetical protein
VDQDESIIRIMGHIMKRIMKQHTTVCAIVGSLILIMASLSDAGIKKCVGPNGDWKYTDRECPNGYSDGQIKAPDTTTSSTVEETGELYECRMATILSYYEIDEATKNVGSMLDISRQEKNRVMTNYLENCLESLVQRKVVLDSRQVDGEVVDEDDGKRRKEKLIVDEWCSYGSVEADFDPGSSRFDVIFTNKSKNACRKVVAVCTYSRGIRIQYTVSVEVHGDREVSPGDSTVIGTVSADDTMNRGRCRLKRSGEKDWPIAD